MAKRYVISPVLNFVHDKNSVRSHVAARDYFGTAATILSLLEQDLQKNGVVTPLLKKSLKNLAADFLFLEKEYQISPKIKNKKVTPNGKLKNQ